MPFELRARLGIGSKDRRFVDEDGSDLPEDVSDPKTIRDESTPTLWEKFRSIRWYLLTLLAFFVVLTIYLLAVGSAIVPELLGNVYFQLALTHTVVGGSFYYFATSSTISRLRDVDWLVLIKPSGLEFYPGRRVAASDDERYHKFIIFKGFTWRGHLSQPLSIADLNPDLARRYKNANRNPEDPAVVRLDPDFGEEVRTEYGTIQAQISNGLRVDTFARSANLVATRSDIAEESRVSKLRKQLQAEKRNVEHYKQLADSFEQRRDEAIEKGKEPLVEWLDEIVEFGERIAEAGRPRKRREDQSEDVAPVESELAGNAEVES